MSSLRQQKWEQVHRPQATSLKNVTDQGQCLKFIHIVQPFEKVPLFFLMIDKI